MTVLITAVLFAVLVSAACSMFEAVLYSVPLRHIESLAQEKKESGKIFKALRADIERPITAILSLNTIANTMGASIAGSAAADVFGHQWLGYFSVAFTLIILLFSEIIPKTAGVVYSRPLVNLVALPLKLLVGTMTPLIWMSSHITGIISKEHGQEHISSDELKIMAQMGLRSGGIKQYQEIVIENILAMDKRIAKDVMTPRTVMFSLSKDLAIKDACLECSRWEHSRIPVYDKGIEDIVGVVLTKEILLSFAGGRKDVKLEQIMRPVHFVAETARLSNLLREFMDFRGKLFVVIDEFGGLSGIISLEDILEDILGSEIIDESDLVADKQKLAKEKEQRLISGSNADG